MPGFKVGYAASSKGTCKLCNKAVKEGALRIGKLVRSTRFDGEFPVWYHAACFLKNESCYLVLNTVGDLVGLDDLRWEDQQLLRQRLPEALKSSGLSDAVVERGLPRFKVETARSSQALCRRCGEALPKDAVKIGRVADTGSFFGGWTALWCHPACFWLQFGAEAQLPDQFLGLAALNEAERAAILRRLPATAHADSGSPALVPKAEKEDVRPGKRARGAKNEPEQSRPVDLAEAVVAPSPAVDDREAAAEAREVWAVRDGLAQHCTVEELRALLAHNGLPTRGGLQALVARLADAALFGLLPPCPECRGPASLRVHAGRCVCDGWRDEWTRCSYSVSATEPQLAPRRCSVPEELARTNAYLRALPLSLRPRLVHPDGPAAPLSTPDLPLLPRRKGSAALKQEEEQQKQTWQVVGRGAVDPASGLAGAHSRVLQEEAGAVYDAHLTLTEISRNLNSYYVVQVIEVTTPTAVSRSRSRGGGGPPRTEWCVWTRWGRVGTDIGDSRLERLSRREDAVARFERLYEAKTGVPWAARAEGRKLPGKYYPMEVDLGRPPATPASSPLAAASAAPLPPADAAPASTAPRKSPRLRQKAPEEQPRLPTAEASPKGASSVAALDERVRALLMLVFDVGMLERDMVEMEIDLTRMPLGKLSQAQLQAALAVLGQAEALLTAPSAPPPPRAALVGLSNRFYTLVPHTFPPGTAPPLLSSVEQLSAARERVDALRQIEVATRLIQAGPAPGVDPLQHRYDQLGAALQPVAREGAEWALVADFLARTHAPTHSAYAMHLAELFTVSRASERAPLAGPAAKRRMLLWHGSRLSNYAGILSQGLRVAPPEAPITGYMFGKGLYFADLASKAANYCRPDLHGPSAGLLLLCEVALGESERMTAADTTLRGPPQGKHSVLGVGATGPDPATWSVDPLSGAVVPVGKPRKVRGVKSELLYNEYVVYSPDQVRLRYLLQVQFRPSYQEH